MKYCSLDIEATGFDPESNEIIELGFVIFEIQGSRMVIHERWEQVFKPSIVVEPKILGLTGIGQSELDSAPFLSEYKEFLVEKLRDAVLVGHNIKFDIAFLEKSGIFVASEHVDTLDLVQVMLPSYPSYNLENIMHGLGIAQDKAHRALSDAESVVQLIQRLLQIYNALPSSTQRGMQLLFPKAHPLWEELFNQDLGAYGFTKPFPKPSKAEPLHVELEPQTFAQVILTDWLEERLAGLLKTKSVPAVLVVSEKSQVLRLWRARLAEGVFLPEDTFDEEKLEQKIDQGPADSNEAKFLIKILVWQATNWQTDSLQDLNLSFFGNQYKSLVSGKALSVKGQLLVCDYSTFLELYKSSHVLHNRKVVVVGLDQFMNAAMTGVSGRLSWSALIRWIEYKLGDPLMTAEHNDLEKLLAQIDLFFGLLQIHFKKLKKPQGFISWEDLAVDAYNFDKCKAAALHVYELLVPIGRNFEESWLLDAAETLKGFFEEQSNYVRWVEQGETTVVLYMQPVSLPHDLYPIAKTTFVDFAMPKDLAEFLLERLGASKFSVQAPKEITQNTSKAFFNKEAIDYSALTEHLLTLSGPAAVIFPTPSQVKRFYDESFERLQSKFKVWAQGYSGGNQKIFNNFAIKPQSILCATPQFITKARGKLLIKDVIWLDFGKTEELSHYFLALGKTSAELPASLQVLHGVLTKLKLKHLASLVFYGWNDDENVISAAASGYIKSVL